MPATDAMPDPWALAVLAVTLAASVAADLKSRRVPNFVTLPAILIGLALAAALAGWAGLTRALGGLAMGAAPMLVCWRLGGIGGGDVKLMAAIGALTNWQFALASLVWALAAATAMAVAVMIRRRIVRRTLKRVGWSLLLAVVPGVKRQWPDQTDSPRLPFALAVGFGALAALADACWSGPITTGLSR